MYGIRTEALVDQTGPHDFRRHAGVDVVIGKAPRGVFGKPQLANVPLWIGERRRYRMPAIQNDRPVRFRVAVAPCRPAAGFAPPVGCFAAAAPELRLSIAIAHGRVGSGVADYGNLSA